jgi:hypothetical protein
MWLLFLIDQHNNIAEETALPIVRRETTTIFNEIPQTRTEHETNVSQQISVTNQKQKPHIPNKENWSVFVCSSKISIFRFNVLTVCSSSQFLLSALNKRSSILDFSLASSFSMYHSRYQLLIKNKNHIFQIRRTQRQQKRQIQLKLKI